MGRRTRAAIEAAAAEANAAAQANAQAVEKSPEPSPEPEAKKDDTAPRIDFEKLRKNRPHDRGMAEVEERDLRTKGLTEEKPEEPKAEPVLQEAAPEAPQEAATAATETPKTIRVKVDGEEYDAAVDEVEAYGGVKNYQITKANENRLKKTNSALEETRKLQAQMAETLQKYFQEQKKPEPTDDQFIAEKIDVIRFGTPQESAAALREIMQRGQQKIDPEDIINKATAKIRHDDAVKKFDQEFNDIVSNPILLEAVLSIRQKRITQLQGQVVDWDNFYRTIGNQVRSAVPQRQSQPQAATESTAGTTSQPSEKEARKASTASITNLPQSSARAETPKEDKPLTYDEARKAAISDMRKSRGLPVG